jgi:pyruvate formate lyase activating enzyme
MTIKGLAKLTLLDFPGRVACMIFTGGCNLRCPFCHNASLAVRSAEVDAIPEEELFSFLGKRRGILTGVCITGGEPLLNPDIDVLIEKIRSLGYAVKLDTNGCFPDRLRALIYRGLVDYVAVDVKNSRENYGKTVGIDGFDVSPIEETIALLKENRVPYELRTTVVKELHSDEDFESIGRWIEGAEGYYLQCFNDSGDLIGEGLTAPSKADLERFLHIVKQYVTNTHIRGI